MSCIIASMLLIANAQTVTSPKSGDIWTWGQTVNITWSGGAGSTFIVSITLHTPQIPKVVPDRTITDSVSLGAGFFQWTIPTDLAPLSDYNLFFSGTGASFYSDYFTIGGGTTTNSSPNTGTSSTPTLPSDPPLSSNPSSPSKPSSASRPSSPSNPSLPSHPSSSPDPNPTNNGQSPNIIGAVLGTLFGTIGFISIIFFLTRLYRLHSQKGKVLVCYAFATCFSKSKE
ncbi:42556_t:CDS:2 [Gigaspora margarita]|uniref:42556_t:CDS:1 n=1 Tax=Gigaspora margarita TaxID=4874 RepID=A0ABN7UVB4_GIGMA|nr:42556_t:CDS:2 [Gigaspora margarita]